MSRLSLLPETVAHRCVLTLFALVLPCFPLYSQEAYPRAVSSVDTLAWLSLEQLGNIRIISVSQREEAVKNVPAAVYVITTNDIRRSGARTVVEALRLVPGVHVAMINASRPAVSIRGFNSEYANKLLVLVDGRSVFTPQFSGVFWDMLDVMMEEIDRIEVVRGPGGSAWGMNAYNGVINIVTKDAFQSQGLLASVWGGLTDPGSAAVRYGTMLSNTIAMRTFLKTSFWGNSVKADGTEWEDHWNSHAAGFRLDDGRADESQWTLLGGINYARPLQYSSQKPLRFQALGGHLLGRWQAPTESDSRSVAQFYYDGVRRHMVQNPVNTDIVDLDVFHERALGSSHRLRLGLNSRYTNSRPLNTTQHVFDPKVRNIYSFAVVVEDAIELVPGVLDMTAGAKLEYHSLADWQFLPSIRASWRAAEDHRLWVNASRGVRAPSTDEADLYINTPFLVSTPNPHPISEKIIALQLGYRGQWMDDVTIDLVGFEHFCRDLGTRELVGGTPERPELQAANMMDGEVYGLEASVAWQAASWWRWKAALTRSKMSLRRDSQSSDASAAAYEGQLPEHQAHLWWSFQLSRSLEADAMYRYVDALPALRVVPYRALDIRLGVRAASWLDLSLIAQNVLDDHHREFGRSPGFPGFSEVPTSYSLKVNIKP